jgi:DNA polymerase sigma
MATLYVENVPDELYLSLRKRARENRKSIAAEIISLLERHIPTDAELKRRQQFYERMETFRTRKHSVRGPHQPVEAMLREDRER